MKIWRRGKPQDAEKSAQSELTDPGADDLLLLLPPDRREAVRLAARRTPRLLLTEGAFNTTLSAAEGVEPQIPLSAGQEASSER
jgi:hypothetical protein